MGIIIFLAVLTATIAIHEYGHYLACRFFRVPVKEFSVGLGAKLFSHRSKGGTEWNFRVLPVGGYVTPVDLEEAKPFARAVIAAAGPFANIFPLMMLAAITGTLGRFLSTLGNLYLMGFSAIIDILLSPFYALAKLFSEPTGEAVAQAGVVGPIGIASQTIALTASNGALSATVILFLTLSLGVAMINLLPIPILDGGHIVSSAIEGVAGKKAADRYESVANKVGVVILLALIVIVTVRDIFNLF